MAKNEKESFVFHDDWALAMHLLHHTWIDAMNERDFSGTQVIAVFGAIVNYNRSGRVPTVGELDDEAQAMFDSIRAQMDEDERELEPECAQKRAR